MKFSLEGFSSKRGQAEERITELECKNIEIIQTDQQNEKRTKKMDRAGETGGGHHEYQYVNHKSPRRRKNKEAEKNICSLMGFSVLFRI